MTFEVDGKQYVAILAGLSRVALGKHAFTPELKEQRNQTDAVRVRALSERPRQGGSHPLPYPW